MSFGLDIIIANNDVRLNKESNRMLNELIVKSLIQELRKRPNNKPKKEGRCFARG